MHALQQTKCLVLAASVAQPLSPWSSISAPVTLEQEKCSDALSCTEGVAMTLTDLPLWRSDRIT